MDGLVRRRPGGASWSIDEIPFRDLDRKAVRNDRQLFHMLATASFVEITSDLYTGNLTEIYRGDDEVTQWLTQHWEPEELQHGAVLKRYVEIAWPDFDWNAGYGRFHTEYAPYCAVERLAPTPALEMAARCVVETGTATFYRALSELTGEPVLKQIAAHISVDEVRHYKNFHRFFERYRALEGTRRRDILRTLWRRAGNIDAEDVALAFKHVFLTANPGCELKPGDYAAFRAHCGMLCKRYYPYEMGVRMVLKPLALPAPVVRIVVPPTVMAARLFLLH